MCTSRLQALPMALRGIRTKWRKYLVSFVFIYITACVCILYFSIRDNTDARDIRKSSEMKRLIARTSTKSSPMNKTNAMSTPPYKCDCSRTYSPKTTALRNPPTELCPDIPTSLVGLMNLSSHVTLGDVTRPETMQHVQPGGSYIPRDCIAKETVAVIIPYRSRVEHLAILLQHLHTVLQRQQLRYTIYVVELAYPSQFNRGLLANVGFLTAYGVTNYTCYVIHDVDLLPVDDRNLYRCGQSPRHLEVSSSKFGYRLPYGHYFGGVIALTPEQYIRVNGFSNFYFGWGKEDDDLYKRIVQSHYKIERPDPKVALYQELPHTRDSTNPDNPMKDGLLTFWERRWRKDGVNNVLYTRLALEFRPLYTWVLANTSEAVIMQRLDRFVPARVKLPRVSEVPPA